MCSVSVADEKIVIPVRWVGIAGAPSVEDPESVGASSTDIMLWQRHERPTDAIYLPMANVSFRSAATQAIKDGPVSFPVIRDPSGTGGDVESLDEYYDARSMAERAWRVGDSLYLDDNNNGIVDSGVDTMLTDNNPQMGFAELGHDGAVLLNAPDNVRFVDGNGDTNYDFGETIYRDENSDGVVDNGDTRLNTIQPTVGLIGPGQLNSPLLNVSSQIKFLDLIRSRPIRLTSAIQTSRESLPSVPTNSTGQIPASQRMVRPTAVVNRGLVIVHWAAQSVCRPSSTILGNTSRQAQTIGCSKRS